MPTVDHPFWLVNERDWVRAGNLFLGDLLLDEEGKEVKIASIEEKIGEVTVYNFEVEENHNYFAEGILVHNADYDEKMVVLQGSVVKTVEQSINKGMNVNQSLDDLIYITQSNPNLNMFQRFYFENKLRLAKEKVLYSSPEELKNRNSSVHKQIQQVLNEIKAEQRKAVLKSSEHIAASIYQAVQEMGEFPSDLDPKKGTN
jgi:hypothetical protein